MAIGYFCDKSHSPTLEELHAVLGPALPQWEWLLRDTPQLHDGRWLFIPVKDDQDAAAVEQLLLVKKRPVKLKV